MGDRGDKDNVCPFISWNALLDSICKIMGLCGDVNSIHVGSGTNIQDNSLVIMLSCIDALVRMKHLLEWVLSFLMGLPWRSMEWLLLEPLSIWYDHWYPLTFLTAIGFGMVILTGFDLEGNRVSDPSQQKAIQFDEQVDWKRKEIGLL
ncbi:hypothetical protein C4D60_Mb03t08900 [Musa balbisiana]|uniref:Uncharacterized protein n=1 Tax=Musa balbisiana TaxID=52838 RepID=A0A4S8J8L7_MUSBA|nr:hypothetical protein C4D60_Mb03t08900 [Musa balbisiana]